MSVILSRNKKKNLSVKVHPMAQDAFDFFHSLQFRFDKIELGTTPLEAISSTQVFRATYASVGEIQLISGFEFTGFSINTFNPIDSLIITENNLTPNEISDIAWRSVLRVLLSSIDSQSLESIREKLNLQVPSPLMSSLFQSEYLTQKKLSAITHLSVSGLKKQTKKTQKTSSLSSEKPAIFAAMKEQFDED
ncbi:hypothetical protein [Vibrio hibernica]|uniref:hypothetical protein n=1 Tax=Vibrio hibernica TaxID=2587465 RepID=UPI0018819374|nr:hypothetical protein [Vibrio hibernica]